MPSLKEYRDRITSVKSTKKITSAMKMVAASKLKKAQDRAEASQPYAKAIAGILARVTKSMGDCEHGPKMLVGTGRDKTHLLIVVTADRGLCGGFNGNLVKRAREEAHNLIADGKDVKIICIGRKAKDLLKRDMGEYIVASYAELGDKGLISYKDAEAIVEYIIDKFDSDSFDVCTLIYNEFKNVLVQKPAVQQLIPFTLSEESAKDVEEDSLDMQSYEFEPDEDVILEKLLPRNLGMQIFRALLDSAAGEQAARMTAMDNATRNAGDMINELSVQYNRARQAYITKELIEIISGAEAV